jgi:hypothetical protein
MYNYFRLIIQCRVVTFDIRTEVWFATDFVLGWESLEVTCCHHHPIPPKFRNLPTIISTDIDHKNNIRRKTFFTPKTQRSTLPRREVSETERNKEASVYISRGIRWSVSLRKTQKNEATGLSGIHMVKKIRLSFPCPRHEGIEEE